MELHTWLDAEEGRAAWLAAELGLTRPAVSFWRASGVPMDRMERVASLTRNAVTVEAMLHHALKARKSKVKA